MKKKPLFFLGLGLVGGAVLYVLSHLEFQDPYKSAAIFQGDFMTDAERKAMPVKAIALRPEFAKLQYQTFKTLITIMDAAHIPYWITCGTLLGAVRHEGMVPHDDDIDINIEHRDVAKILALKKHLNKKGLNIYQDRTSIKVYKINGIQVRPKKSTFKIWDGLWFVRRKIERFPTIDIYPVTRRDGYVVHANDRALRAFKNEVYQVSDIYPLKNYNFGPLVVKGPANPYFFLEHNYGAAWNQYYIAQGTHVPGLQIQIKQPLTPELRKQLHRYAVD